MYASLLGMSGALHLDIFDQPAQRVFFSNLLDDTARKRGKRGGLRATKQKNVYVAFFEGLAADPDRFTGP